MSKMIKICKMVEIDRELDRIRTSHTTSISGREVVDVWNYLLEEKGK